jgi:hypothetical protein
MMLNVSALAASGPHLAAGLPSSGCIRTAGGGAPFWPSERPLRPSGLNQFRRRGI